MMPETPDGSNVPSEVEVSLVFIEACKKALRYRPLNPPKFDPYETFTKMQLDISPTRREERYPASIYLPAVVVQARTR
jgi:hypothetical protein